MITLKSLYAKLLKNTRLKSLQLHGIILELQQHLMIILENSTPSMWTKMLEIKCTLKKPWNLVPNEQANCMTTLLQYSNKLLGIDQLTDDEANKKTIFKSFPDDWQITYNRSWEKVTRTDYGSSSAIHER